MTWLYRRERRFYARERQRWLKDPNKPRPLLLLHPAQPATITQAEVDTETPLKFSPEVIATERQPRGVDCGGDDRGGAR